MYASSSAYFLRVLCFPALVLQLANIDFIEAKLQALQLPSYVGKPCKLNDPNINDCIVRTGAPIIKRISQGDPKYRIPRLEPLTIPEMRIEQGNRQIGLTMQCKNCQLHGLSDVKFVASRADINKHHVEWDFMLDKLMFLGKYKVTGQVLVLPITGDGNANITLSKVKFTFIYDFDLEKRANGREYCIIRNTTLPYSLGGLKIKLDNLFNGDKLLGDNMNNFLNENWKELVKEIGPSVADALSDVFTNTMGSMADLVPYDNMFPPN